MGNSSINSIKGDGSLVNRSKDFQNEINIYAWLTAYSNNHYSVV